MIKKLLCLLVLLLTATTGALGMQIYISYPSWPTGTNVNGDGNLVLEIEASDSFENVKAKIEDKSGLNPTYMKLYFNSVEMANDETLNAKGVTSNSVLTLVYTLYNVTMKDGVKDATNWTITPAEATTTGVTEGQTVTLQYNGRLKVKGVKATSDAVPPAPPAEGHTLAKSAVGELVGSDGKAYAAADKNNLPDGVTAVALVCYKNGSKGLALALADEGRMNCSTAISTCEGKTPTVTGCTWKLATQDEWNNMISGAGGYAALRDGFTSVGGTNLQSNWYWSSRKYPDSTYYYDYYFREGRWSRDNKDTSIYVRAALAF